MMQHAITPVECRGKLAAKIKSRTPYLRTSDILHMLKKIIFGSQKTHLSWLYYTYSHIGVQVLKEETTNPPNGTTIQWWLKEKLSIKTLNQHINTNNKKEATKVAHCLANVQRFCFTGHHTLSIHLHFQIIKLYIYIYYRGK